MRISTRREFLIASALSMGAFVVSTGLGGCGSDGSDSGVKVAFNHGVASGDPLHDRVILWTRVTPNSATDSLEVRFEVATDDTFKNLVRPAETATISAAHDYTLKVDFQNLQAGSTYFYRFTCNGVTSPVGRTKTLPQGALSQAKFAVFSCSNYPNGHFNAYSEAAKIADLDATIHTGDYIYEYGMFEKDGVTPAYATAHAAEYGRVLPSDNNTELLTLEDYRKRYALYHTDAGLQAIHAACPMIVVWDDHEIANDAYKTGAQNHDESEGSFSERKANALQAYFEWLPIRPYQEGNYETIYRSFTYGDLLSLHMLDTRIIGRDQQLSYADFPELM
ncbi:MAG: alkaline phosphatase D family protein [Campylobacterales bacterium]|nr:alkaline phosphatase D family protein [Campylobacterales bacterium]